MLKTYTIKLFDIYRREIVRKIKSPDRKTQIEGWQSMFKLGASMMIMGATSDLLKDLLLNRKIDLSETMIDNMLKIIGLSKYQIYKSRQDGIGQMVYQAMIVPPLLSPLDNISRDIYRTLFGKKEYDVKDWRTWNALPFIGKFYYWWFGGGHEQEKKKKS